MSFWKYLVDSERRQRDDIDELAESLEVTTRLARDTQAQQGDVIRDLVQRVDQLELMLQTLFVHFERGGQLDKEGFVTLMTQIDLADGRLDGKIGPDKTSSAFKCDACEKPVSSKRATCIYCGAEIDWATKKKRRRRR